MTCTDVLTNIVLSISTHTPLAGRDWGREGGTTIHQIFLLTRPSRDVTIKHAEGDWLKIISTHTPLAGRDKEDG